MTYNKSQVLSGMRIPGTPPSTTSLIEDVQRYRIYQKAFGKMPFTVWQANGRPLKPSLKDTQIIRDYEEAQKALEDVSGGSPEPPAGTSPKTSTSSTVADWYDGKGYLHRLNELGEDTIIGFDPTKIYNAPTENESPRQLPDWLANQPNPYDNPSTTEIEGYRDSQGNWQPPPGWMSPADERDFSLRQQQFQWQQQQAQMQMEADRQSRLANLRANPASWIEYNLQSGQQPTVQSWMPGLLPQGSGLKVGDVIPGFNPQPQPSQVNAPPPSSVPPPGLGGTGYNTNPQIGGGTGSAFQPGGAYEGAQPGQRPGVNGLLPGTQALPGMTNADSTAIIEINRKIAAGLDLTPAERQAAINAGLQGSVDFYDRTRATPPVGGAPTTPPPTALPGQPPPVVEQLPPPTEPPPETPAPGQPPPNWDEIVAEHPDWVGMFANGGIAWSPTRATIGEREPEAVIPLSKMGWMGGQNQQSTELPFIDTMPKIDRGWGMPPMQGWMRNNSNETAPQTTNPGMNNLPGQLPTLPGATGQPQMLNPSMQYLRRMNPSQLGQYQSYEKSRTGMSPEDLQWLWQSTAPSGGQNPGLRWMR